MVGRKLLFSLIIALVCILNTFAFKFPVATFQKRIRVSDLYGFRMNGEGPATLDGYGTQLFKGAVAAPYLQKQGLASNVLDGYDWTTDGNADKIAAAVLDWAKDNGASVYCHWFQPLGASGLRHGQSAQVHNTMMEFKRDGSPAWDFKGKNILQGETDGSSYPNGGLRATHRAGGYLTVDPTSPIFLRGDTIFIPACLASYDGFALDEKIPLLRASDALTKEGTRLLGLLGYKVDRLDTMIGLEQEFFFVPRDSYKGRVDLQMAGRTVLGRMPPRGQELSDHYMAPPSLASAALACMQDIQDQCFKIGIPLRTRHREVAPNQYEFAPLYGTVTTQIDQNLMVMQIIEETAAQYGLAALFQEKPFQGVNGSGKHNNWSIATSDGTNLFNVEQLAQKTGTDEIFPIIMAAIIKAVDENGDLMRMAIATPGNDFRLGACEAPPAIMSMYLGEDMTKFLEAYCTTEDTPAYKPMTKLLLMGAKALAPLLVPAQDRNRSSPFPYGGHRFEFRAVGSSQNVSLVNTILAAIVAYAFKDFADQIEKGAKAKDVAKAAIQKSKKVIFNGNGYDSANQEMLTKNGLWRIDSGVDAILRITEPKNMKLLSEMGVFSAEECAARKLVMLRHYVGMVEIEAQCMVDMLNQHVLPAVKAAGLPHLSKLHDGVMRLRAEIKAIHASENDEEKAQLARKLRLETMLEVRAVSDDAEGEVPVTLWTLPTYTDLLFLDQVV